MKKEEIRKAVRDSYGRVAAGKAATHVVRPIPVVVAAGPPAIQSVRRSDTVMKS